MSSCRIISTDNIRVTSSGHDQMPPSGNLKFIIPCSGINISACPVSPLAQHVPTPSLPTGFTRTRLQKHFLRNLQIRLIIPLLQLCVHKPLHTSLMFPPLAPPDLPWHLRILADDEVYAFRLGEDGSVAGTEVLEPGGDGGWRNGDLDCEDERDWG